MEKIKIFGINYNLELKTVKTLERGYDLYDNNDFGSAVNLFSSLQNNSNLKPFIFTLRGHAYHCLNKLEEAINDYNKTLSFYPTNYAALYRLAMVYYAKFDLKNSIKCLEKSLQNYPDIDTNYEDYLRNEMFNIPKVVILNNIGNFLGQIGKYDDSFKFFDEAIKLSPEYSFVYLSKGLMILEKSDNKEKATEYIRKAYELGNKKAYIFLSIIKRDYNAIITESNYNPLNIVNYTEQNKAHRLPNFIET